MTTDRDTPTSTDEVKPTPVGEFNYRPGVSVRSANQPQTELRESLKRDLDILHTVNHKKGERPDLYAEMNLIDKYVEAHQEKAVREAELKIAKKLEAECFRTPLVNYEEFVDRIDSIHRKLTSKDSEL